MGGEGKGKGWERKGRKWREKKGGQGMEREERAWHTSATLGLAKPTADSDNCLHHITGNSLKHSQSVLLGAQQRQQSINSDRLVYGTTDFRHPQIRPTMTDRHKICHR